MNRAAVLMSIKPQYADLIFEGRKTVELRRVCPKVARGDRVLVYASGPRMQLMGEFKVGGVVSGTPEELRSKCLEAAGVSKAVFDEYFVDSSEAFGILIESSKKLTKPTPLGSLRERKSGFRPPQSYCYLTENDYKRLVSHDRSKKTAGKR